MTSNKKETPIERLLRVSGGTPAIAEALGISRQFVRLCVNRGWFPPRRAKKLETLYGVPCKKLANPELAELLG